MIAGGPSGTSIFSLSADQHGIARIQATTEIAASSFHVGAGEVDFVDDRDNRGWLPIARSRWRSLAPALTLRGVHQQERSFAGRETVATLRT
ncbi:MAG: hypothetical protein MRJ92_09810 [Nitrospira sp.]|nr:hypothetical protein [Nitrospira sp.]